MEFVEFELNVKIKYNKIIINLVLFPGCNLNVIIL